MAKHNFSNSVNESLNGRSRTPSQQTPTPPIATEHLNTKEDSDNTSESPKPKKKVGRKKLNAADKRKQMVLTLSASTYKKLMEWAETKPKSAPNYVSDFVDEHVDDIIK